MEKYCSGCNSWKSKEEFGKNKHKGDGLQSRCKICRTLDNREYYLKTALTQNIKRRATTDRRDRELKAKLVAYLQQHTCVDCNNSDIRVLEFDHLRDKQFEIGKMLRRSMAWEKILAEIEKCDIVCANCHKIRTAERSNNYRHRAVMGI